MKKRIFVGLLIAGAVTIAACGKKGDALPSLSVPNDLPFSELESLVAEDESMEEEERDSVENDSPEFPEYELYSAKDRYEVTHEMEVTEVEPIVSAAPISFSYKCGPFDFRMDKSAGLSDDAKEFVNGLESDEWVNELFIGQGYVRTDVNVSWDSLSYLFMPDEYNTDTYTKFKATFRDKAKGGELTIAAHQVCYVTWDDITALESEYGLGDVSNIRTTFEAYLFAGMNRQKTDEDKGDWYVCGDNLICIVDQREGSGESLAREIKEGGIGVHAYVCRYASGTVDGKVRAYVVDLFGTGDFTKDDVLQFARGIQIDNGSVEVDEDYVPEHVYTKEEIEELKKQKERHDREVEEAKERLRQYEEKTAE